MGDQNRLHQVEGKTLEKVEATNNTRMADSAHMESTSVEKREILRKFQIAKKTPLGHSDCTAIRKTRVRTRVQITSNKKYSSAILKICKSQLGQGSTYI